MGAVFIFGKMILAQACAIAETRANPIIIRIANDHARYQFHDPSGLYLC